MSILVAILIVILPAAVFLVLFLVKKTSWYNAFFFGFFVLLALLFLFRQEWTFRFERKTKPPVIFLIDKSLSVAGIPHHIPGEILKKYPVYYFADTVSERTNGLNPEITSLYDAVRSLRNTAGPAARIFAVSDFNDNGSVYLNRPEKSPYVYPVILRKKNTAPENPVLYDVRFPDFVEAGEPVGFTVLVYAPRVSRADLEIRDGEKILFRKSVTAGPEISTNDLTLPEGPGFTGNRILTFRIAGSSGDNRDQTVLRSVDSIPAMQKILFLCGRPSEEFAFLKRFLEKIRWLRTEVVLLKSAQETFQASRIDARYHAVILMDLSPAQLTGGWPPKIIQASSVPVFYQTGLRAPDEIYSLVRAFTNLRPAPLAGTGEKKFSYNGNDLIIQTSCGMDQDLIDAGQHTRVFFGWGTWKWDFIRSKEDIAYNLYDSFWQNQINYLLSASVSASLPEKLNEIAGENPERPAVGNYTIQTNGKSFLVRVGHNPPEVSGIPANIKAASFYQTNLFFADQPLNYPELIRQAAGNELVKTVQTIRIDFTRNWFVFLLMALSLILFWIFRDREAASK